MPTFTAHDGTELAYRTAGAGEALICLPGGPMQDSVYLGDLGGLSEHYRLIVLDLRGTGQSAIPDDPASYRCDRLVADVEALREHLGLERINLLGHSAATHLATLYAAQYPHRTGALILVGPSGAVAGITVTVDARREVAQLRRDELWFPTAFAALERITTGQARDEDWDAIAPFFAGRWDATAQQQHAAANAQTNQEAAEIFASEGAFDPPATRTALAAVEAPVLLVAGQYDLNSPPSAVAEFAALFPKATVDVLPGAGHHPWTDDAAGFVSSLTAFLR